MTDTDTTIDADVRPARPIEFRSVSDFEVRWADRTIELVAMPYDVDAAVMVHGRAVIESCAPGSFAGVERRVNRVKVNRDHDYERTIGRAVALHPSRAEGLVAELRIAKTPLGDETLALADDHSLEASVGFAAMPGGEQWLEHRSRRRITKAFLDHIGMVPEGAYEGRILAVRGIADASRPAAAVPASTPNLDEVRLWMLDGGVSAARTMPVE
jgi:phage head maturation protease